MLHYSVQPIREIHVYTVCVGVFFADFAFPGALK